MLEFVLLLNKVRICIIIFRIGISYFILLTDIVCVCVFDVITSVVSFLWEYTTAARDVTF